METIIDTIIDSILYKYVLGSRSFLRRELETIIVVILFTII
jgi:hypothetical protein